MLYKKKKGYISIEYIIITSVVVIACGFVYVQAMPQYGSQVNQKIQGIVELISSDETIVNQ